MTEKRTSRLCDAFTAAVVPRFAFFLQASTVPSYSSKPLASRRTLFQKQRGGTWRLADPPGAGHLGRGGQAWYLSGFAPAREARSQPRVRASRESLSWNSGICERA